MRKSSLKWVVAILVVIAACIGAFFIAKGIVSRFSTSLSGQVKTNATSAMQTYVLGDGIVYYDGVSVHSLDSQGRRKWSFAAGAGADFSVADAGVAVWSGTKLSILDANNGQTKFTTSDMDRTIIDACCSSYYSAIQVGDENDSDIVVIDSSGRQIDVMSFANLTVLRFGFFNNGMLFWVMSLNTQGTTPICSISTYRPGKMLTGTISDTQQVVYEVVFRSNNIRAVGTTHVKSFDYTAKEIASERTLVYGWYLMSIDEKSDDPLMLFVPNAQSDGTQPINDVRMIRGLTENRVRLSYPAFKVVCLGDTMYGFGNQYLSIAKMTDQSPTVYALPIYADGVIGITKNKTAVVESGGNVYLLPLPK